jgi:hypothetical protein
MYDRIFSDSFKEIAPLVLPRLPSGNSLKKVHLKVACRAGMRYLGELLANKPFSVIVDESPTDAPKAAEVLSVVVLTASHSIVGFANAYEEGHPITHVEVEAAVNTCLQELHLRWDDCHGITTDNGSYVVKAAREMTLAHTNATHLRCLSHGLALVCAALIEEFDDAHDFLLRLRQYICKGNLLGSRRQRLRMSLGGRCLRVLKFVDTRWGTCATAAVYVDEKYETIAKLFTDIVAERKLRGKSARAAEKISLRLRDVKLRGSLHALAALLQPFPALLKESQSRDTVTPAMLSRLRALGESLEQFCVPTFAERLSGGCIETKADIARMVATACKAAHEKHQKYVRPGVVIGLRRAFFVPRHAPEAARLGHFGTVSDIDPRIGESLASSMELAAYREAWADAVNEEAHDFWNSRLSEFPLLSRAAARALSLSVTGAPVERSFSVLRALLSKQRRRIGQEYLTRQFLLAANASYWTANVYAKICDGSLLTKGQHDAEAVAVDEGIEEDHESADDDGPVELEGDSEVEEEDM